MPFIFRLHFSDCEEEERSITNIRTKEELQILKYTDQDIFDETGIEIKRQLQKKRNLKAKP